MHKPFGVLFCVHYVNRLEHHKSTVNLHHWRRVCTGSHWTPILDRLQRIVIICVATVVLLFHSGRSYVYIYGFAMVCPYHASYSASWVPGLVEVGIFYRAKVAQHASCSNERCSPPGRVKLGMFQHVNRCPAAVLDYSIGLAQDFWPISMFFFHDRIKKDVASWDPGYFFRCPLGYNRIACTSLVDDLDDEFHKFNGHFRDLDKRGTYLPNLRPKFQGYVQHFPHNIWPCMYSTWNSHWQFPFFPSNPMNSSRHMPR